MVVYLDHAATTPMLPEAIAAYTAALGVTGNPSSIHSHGQNAKRMLEEAREQIAASLGCDPIEVVFTSGGTESVNLAIKGLWWARNDTGSADSRRPDSGRGTRPRAEQPPRPRILVPLGEHHATVDTVEWLERYEGAVVEWLPIDSVGRVSLASIAAALDAHDDIALLSLLWANNEVGTIQPIHEIVALAASHGVPVHADAVSAYGHLPIDFAASGLAALSVSAHKIGGPLGIGALALSRTATVVPLIHGGGQQRQVRSGTQDAPAAVAFAAAVQHPFPDLSPLRDRLIAGVRAAVPDARLCGPDPAIAHEANPFPEATTFPEALEGNRPSNTSPNASASTDAETFPEALEGNQPSTAPDHPAARLPNNAHFVFPGCEGDSLLMLLDAAGVSVSTGSACQAGVPEPSHVLMGIGLTESEARGALRFTLGHTSTAADVDALLAALPAAHARARRAGLAGRVVSSRL